ncbi:MAG: ABC transporter ATP-binding protein/permease [Eubacterium sp.]|nr:ABC transporter ATP-binding protein/permease [Eubacterium sp.]
MKKLSKYMKGLWLLCAVSGSGMIIEAACELSMPKLAELLHKNVEGGNADSAMIIRFGLGMFLLALIGLAGGICTMKASSVAAQRFSYRLRKDVYKKISDFSFKNIDRFSTSSLTTRMTNDITAIQNTLLFGLRMLFRAPALLIVAAVMAIRINPRLSLLLAVVLPFVGVLVAVGLKIGFPLFQKMQKKIDNVNRVVQENLIGIRVVKAYVREDREKDKFHDASDDLAKMGATAAGLVVSIMPVLMLMLNGIIIYVYYKGANDAYAGKMDVGEISVFANYIVQVLMNIMMVSMMFIMVARAKACGDRVVEVLDEEIDIKNPEKPFVPESSKGRVEFNNVSFGYIENDRVLKNINFTAEAGSVIGIIGSTGCGKSSLVNLIPRLYDVNEGSVLVDGVDVREYDLTALRDIIGVVLQKNVLFSGSIKENIRWGKPDATDEEIINACKSAQADAFVNEQPDRYDTDLSQGGLNLSGGQKQRLCIARAMIKNPKILILDDSTSAVDTATEAKIRDSFYNEFEDTTVFIIAQRISSVKDADKILVIDDGELRGEGTHEELIENNEIYREIYETQQKGVQE